MCCRGTDCYLGELGCCSSSLETELFAAGRMGGRVLLAQFGADVRCAAMSRVQRVLTGMKMIMTAHRDSDATW